MLQLGKPKIGFLAFFLLWAERMRWDVPPLHVRVCVWLEAAWLSGAPLLLLMLPRGHAKSTILGIFNAWLYYCWPVLRILHQSEADGTALKTSRDTQHVLRKHPLTAGLLPEGQGTVESWWTVAGWERDPRNASMYAKGILSNVTSSRADFIQNDDIEVPRNIQTPEAREKLRFRLGEQVHIAVPGAPKMYIGTPHTHESIYDEIKALGAESLIVRMFEREHRIENANETAYRAPFHPEYVFSGIGKGARLLREGVDYRYERGQLLFASPPIGLVDAYADAAWPERFTREELEKRRKECRTVNEWDSQYQLHAKPVTQLRLDPARIVPYNVDPQFRRANGGESMWLGKQQIVGASCRWDPASGKLKSDVSGVAVVLQDEAGRRYVQHVGALTGEVAEFDEKDGKTIVGGQVWQLCDIIERYSLPRVTVETNGIGGFAPTVLRAALKQRKLRCGVVEISSSTNKNKRILETIEPLLLSRGMLWAHVDLLRDPDKPVTPFAPGEFWRQMRDWNPAVADQDDDLLDAVSGAISDTPERFRGKGGISPSTQREDWRPEAGTFEVAFER